MSHSVEEIASPPRASDADMYRLLDLHLNWAERHLSEMQNNFEATVQRRRVLERCVRIADQYGHEVRHGGR